MELYFEYHLVLSSPIAVPGNLLLPSMVPFPEDSYFLLRNGKLLPKNELLSGKITIVCRAFGGKGGFGSMLRAIGAQIEKTTNREACRDLSGRRLRDINEEQRLKNWIDKQAEREKEAAEKKKKKLERMLAEPKHEFRDAEYDRLRSELPEKVEDAVTQGLQASCSTKRGREEEKGPTQKKKLKLWIDEDLSGSGSDSGDEETEAATVNSDNVVAIT